MKKTPALLIAVLMPVLAWAAAEPETPNTAIDSGFHSVAIGYTHDSFDQGLDPWNEERLSVKAKVMGSKAIARVRRGDRFDTRGIQTELDAYPSLGEGAYGYLNVGYSASEIFPKWRTGAEYFRSLPGKFEASLGFRQLRFSGTPVTLITGSVTKYLGNYVIIFRPYYVPDDIGASLSGSLAVRRYLNDSDYVAVSGGAGRGFEQRSSTLEIFRQRSWKYGAEASFEIVKNYRVSPAASVEWSEYFPESFRRQKSFSIDLEYLF